MIDREAQSIKHKKQSTLIKEGQNLTKLKVVCALAGQFRKETHQSFYLTGNSRSRSKAIALK